MGIEMTLIVPVRFQVFFFCRTSLVTHSEGNLKNIGSKYLLAEIMCQTELCLSRLSYKLPVTVFQLTRYTKLRENIILTSLITESLGFC
jgi:hypothetical protein